MRIGLVAAVAGVWLAGVAALEAQNVGPSGPAPRAEVFRTTGTRIGLARSVHIARDQEVTDAVVAVGGSVRVDGRVRGEVVAVGGDVVLGPEAVVTGDIVVVGGQVTREPGAHFAGRVSGVTFDDWIARWDDGWIALPRIELGGFWRWLVLFGALFRVALLAVLMAAVLVVARAPVARVGRAAAAEPLKAALVGIAAILLFLPVLIVTCAALALTIVGIPLIALVVPAALLLAIGALLLGFTGLVCRLGEWIEDRLGWRVHSAFVAGLLGLLLVVGPTLASRLLGVTPGPVEGVAFALLVAGAVAELSAWVVGLGAALMTGFGRWSTQPPPVPPTVDAVVV
ncbi:MAG: polymer-forming cytoskeletal protein [Acidobacteriota bacterium]